MMVSKSSLSEGSSPRVRSRLAVLDEMAGVVGIISACAEQTTLSVTAAVNCTDHLRVCGADFSISSATIRQPGSSPRVRSRPPGRPPP